MKCRFCSTEVEDVFIDLGFSPPSNSFLVEEQLDMPEIYYPLKVFVCSNCFLVQACDAKNSEDIFNEDYIYYSSFSKSWLKHAENYVNIITQYLDLNQNSFVVEIASNDGYLLQYFLEKKIPILGVEPSKGTAKIAIEKGIKTVTEYFSFELSERLLSEYKKADLIVGNNVFAHVPTINDFVKGIKNLLKHDGVLTLEFPHLLQLVENNQFDTIYHEHFFYYSFSSAQKIFIEHGLEIFNVEQLKTHGGSLRIYVQHKESGVHKRTQAVNDLLNAEKEIGVDNIEFYKSFQSKSDKVKNELLGFLLECKKNSKKVVAYGAAAKGNTLLNYAGIKSDLINYVIDASPHKQGKFLPGSHIPVLNELELQNDKPEYVLILPWNIKDEVIMQLNYIREWDGKFVVVIPAIKIYDN